MSGCTMNWGSGNMGSDPLFTTGILGGYYLSQIASGQGADSPCLNSGSDTVESLGLDETTTRTDQVFDVATADIGYHYPLHIEAVISSIIRSESNVIIEWTPRVGANYTVQWSTDMQNWNSIPVGQTGSWEDTNTGAYQLKYYRVFE
jgi:hypothetical protein